MHKIIIYFIGGSSAILEECNENCTQGIVKWLDSETKETFKVNIPDANRTKCFRKESIIFIDIE